jgi:hypothetical protein
MEITQAAVKKILKELTGQAQFLTIPRPFVAMTGDHVCALFLSQIIYWSERTSDPEGWFYKTHEEWAEELCLTPYQVRRATEKLARLGVQSKVRKLKGQGPKLHYRLDDERFTKAFIEYLNNKETSLLSDSKVKKLNNKETSLLEGEETSLLNSEETQLTPYKDAEITSAKTTREHTHTARSAPSPAEEPPAQTGVCVSGSKFSLQQVRAWTDHQKANGAKIDPYAVALCRFKDGEADADIELWLAAGMPTAKVIPRDTSACPDCYGKGFYYPEGTAKGVAKCTHPRLADGGATKQVPARASP